MLQHIITVFDLLIIAPSVAVHFSPSFLYLPCPSFTSDANLFTEHGFIHCACILFDLHPAPPPFAACSDDGDQQLLMASVVPALDRFSREYSSFSVCWPKQGPP
jgi:hypothetical protein